MEPLKDAYEKLTLCPPVDSRPFFSGYVRWTPLIQKHGFPVQSIDALHLTIQVFFAPHQSQTSHGNFE